MYAIDPCAGSSCTSTEREGLKYLCFFVLLHAHYVGASRADLMRTVLHASEGIQKLLA